MKRYITMLCAFLGPWAEASAQAPSPSHSEASGMGQPLSVALADLAKQTGFQLVYVSDEVQGATTKGSAPGLPPQETLANLLLGTGLTFEFLNERTVRIYPKRGSNQKNADLATEVQPQVAAGPSASASKKASKDQGKQPMVHKSALSRIFGLLLTCGSVIHAGNACAQDAGATSGATPSQLEEVIVTATKRPENLQNVPFTVSVVSEEDVQAQNFADTSDLKRLVPDLQYQHGNNPGNDSFGIRGISTFALGQGLEQSVGVALDGAPLGRAAGSVADLVDIHSVEVLKGPQGTLFGKNASGGLINIVSNSPELGKTTVDVRAAFGTLRLNEYSGTLNLPLTEQSALRLTAWQYRHDGPVDEVNTNLDMNNKNSSGARAKLRWKPNDDLELNASAEWTSHHQNGTGYTIRAFDPANYTVSNAGALVQAWELAHGTVPSNENRISRSPNMPLFDNGHGSAFTGQADYGLGGGTLTAIVSYRSVINDDQFNSWPSDNPYVYHTSDHDVQRYTQLSEEIHYASPVSDRLHYVAGLFNFRLNVLENLALGSNVYGTPFFVDNDFYTPEKNNNYAGFGEATFDATQKLHLIAGLRESTDTLDASMQRTYQSPPPPIYPSFNGPGTSFGPYSTSVSTTYHDLSWRAAVQYQMLPDAMVYVTVSRGYKGPGDGYSLTSTARSLAAANNGLVKPEISHNFETGLKTQWFDRRLTINLALYEEFLDDFQTTLVLPVSPVVLAVENAKQARTRGVDLDARWSVTRELSLALSVALDDARYTDFKNASCYGGQTAAQGCVNSTQNLDGGRLPNTPKTLTYLTARYERPIGERLLGYGQANYSYRSTVTFSSSGDPMMVQAGYGLLNLNFGFETPNSRWDLNFYGKNILNKRYVDAISYVSNNIYYTNDIGYEDLRTFGVALSAHL